MTDAGRLFVVLLAFRSTAPGSETVSFRRRLIRAPSSKAARERALALGEEGVPPDSGDSSGRPWIFAGVQAITEIELWHGEGLDELDNHVKAELAANPFLKLSGPD